MTPPLQRDSILKPKRTRICGPQSKSGCFTCKARRIKCDEDKPACRRCARSGRVCGGYPERERDAILAAIPLIQESRADAFRDHRPLVKPNPSWALHVGCPRSERQHRLAQLGIDLLSFDSFGRFGAAGTVLDILLPQLCLSIPSVHVAATALGAVQDMQAAYSSGSPANEAVAASQYHIALRAMQRDLRTQPHGPIPLIMICLILGVAEILLQQESNALFHLRGASQLLQDRRYGRQAPHPARAGALDSDLCSLDDEIGIIFRTVDFQTCSYALSRPPDLPAISLPPILPSITDLSSAHVTLVQLVHACYDFASTAYKFKYQPQSASPALYIEQGRHIAHLSTWLEQFKQAVRPILRQDPTSPSQVKFYSHALTLRMTALSILIHLSCILCPYETAFHAHAPHFQQIVTDGEAIMSARHREPESSPTGIDCRRFTTGPGLIQPLFLTAFKYRHPLYRRRAIALLSTAGREGPWCGQREARVTTRLMELEETWSSDSSRAFTHKHPTPAAVPAGAGENDREGLPTPSPTTSVLAGGVDFDSAAAATDVARVAQAFGRDGPSTKPRESLPERAKRAHAVEMAESALINEVGISSENLNGRPANRVIVRFCKCQDIDAVLSYPCGHGPGQGRNLDAHSQGPCTDNPHWEKWVEVLQF